MVFTLIHSYGAEPGNIEVIPVVDCSETIVQTNYKKSGSYSFYQGNNSNGFFRFPIAALDEVYVGFWILELGQYFAGDGWVRCGVILSDGKVIDVRPNKTTNCFDAYVDDVLKASGVVVTNPSNWVNIQIHFKIADAGNIDYKVDGIAETGFSGDTKPGAVTDISYIRFSMPAASTGRSGWVDDIVIGTGDYPGDIRILPMTPNSDDTVGDWTRSAAGSDYALVDEIPPNTTDYIYTGVTGNHSYVGLTDPTLTNLTPQWCKLYNRALKDGSGGTQQIKLVDKEGASINTGGATNILTSYDYYTKTLLTAPDGTAWDAAHVNALIVGVESVVA